MLTVSRDFAGGCTSRDSAGEKTSSQEGTFQGTIAVHTTSTKARDFTGGIQTGQGLSIHAEDAAREVGLQSSEGLAREDPQSNRNERPGRGIEEPVRPGHTHQPVAKIGAGGS